MIEKQLFYNKTNKKIQMYYDLNYKFYNSLDDMRYKKNISIEKVRIKTHLAQLEYNFKIIKYTLTSFYISYIKTKILFKYIIVIFVFLLFISNSK
ncbi:hypothetical protein C4U57_01195 [Clostridioides difficile]